MSAERVQKRRRQVAVAALVVVICAGLTVHGLLPDTAATDIAGDALYAAAAYLAVVLIAPGIRPMCAGAIAAAWCVAVELLQLTGLPSAAGAAFPPAMLLLGTAFDPRDLLVYLVMAAVCAAIDAAVPSTRHARDRSG